MKVRITECNNNLSEQLAILKLSKNEMVRKKQIMEILYDKILIALVERDELKLTNSFGYGKSTRPFIGLFYEY